MHTRVRQARIADLLPDDALGARPARRLEATAVVVPGVGGLDAYVAKLTDAHARFREWDGRVVVLARDREAVHRVIVVDRYGQVYAVFDGGEEALPDVSALEEWFRFLATACPECGVLDDPIGRGWTP
jgi:hypothetical protein